MFSKKAVALVMMAAVAVIASQPAVAGVGGCRTAGVGGCGDWQLSSNPGTSNRTPALLDSLTGAVRADVIAFLKALFDRRNDHRGGIEQPGDTTSQGVGGCRFPGVGGCGDWQ